MLAAPRSRGRRYNGLRHAADRGAASVPCDAARVLTAPNRPAPVSNRVVLLLGRLAADPEFDEGGAVRLLVLIQQFTKGLVLPVFYADPPRRHPDARAGSASKWRDTGRTPGGIRWSASGCGYSGRVMTSRAGEYGQPTVLSAVEEAAAVESEAMTILLEASRIVRRSGWVQHTMVSKTGRVCAAAAIAQAVDTTGRELPPPIPGQPMPGEAGYQWRAQTLLRQALKHGPLRRSGWQAVLLAALARFEAWLELNGRLVGAPPAHMHAPAAWWNDQPDRTGGGEVAKVLYLAAVEGRKPPPAAGGGAPAV